MPDPTTTVTDPQDPPVMDPDAPIDSAAVATTTTDAGEKTVFTDEIDLGNGQKLEFEADSPEELREKIFAKMRELATSQPAEVTETTDGATTETTAATASTETAPAPVKKGRQLTQDEEFAIGEEFKKGNPTKALEQFLEKRYGLSLEEVSDAVVTMKSEREAKARWTREHSAVDAWMAKHQTEYVPSPHNQKVIGGYLETRGLEATVENLELAFKDLSSVGLITGANGSTTTATTPNTSAAATTNGAAVKRVAASGIFGKAGAPPRTPTNKKPKVLSNAEVEKIAREQGSDALLAALEEQDLNALK